MQIIHDYLTKQALSVAPKILCIGEVSWDRVGLVENLPPRKESRDPSLCHLDLATDFAHEGPGGCALNSAFALRALGAEVTLAGNLLGHDEPGKKLFAAIEKWKIRSLLKQDSTVKTPIAKCYVDKATAERDFDLEHDDIQKTDNESILPSLIAETKKGTYSHVFVQPYLKEISRDYLEAVQGSPAWILVQDLKPDSEFVGLSNAIQISLEDVGAEFNVRALTDLAKPYFKDRTTELFITAGAKGVAHVRKRQEARLYDGLRMRHKVVDTTGCGDAFRAGLMYALAHGESVDRAIWLGQEMGAFKVGVLGSCLMEKI